MSISQLTWPLFGQLDISDENRWFLPIGGSKHPPVRMHFTPTSGSWLNLVEVFFGIITRQAIWRGTFTSVKDLIGAIETFIDAWNDRCQPFGWTKTADEILTKANRKVTSNTRHQADQVLVNSPYSGAGARPFIELVQDPFDMCRRSAEGDGMA